jgi:four helix bundle protein
MRDYTKLEVFHLADDLALMIYRLTASFPAEGKSPLAEQLRRAAVSIPSNIVEGCSRYTEPDFLHFMDIAYGSAREAGYQLYLAQRLNFIANAEAVDARILCTRVCKALAALTISIRHTRTQSHPRG